MNNRTTLGGSAPKAPSRFGRLRIRIWGWVFIALAPIIGLGLTSCGTNTNQEIKTINGKQFLCTWTETAMPRRGDKKDYRCEAFQG